MNASASLPHHLYVWVDRTFIRENGEGFERAVWFGLHAHPGRVWGCHVMLECGAVYRNLPPHALAFSDEPEPWTVEQSQLWDCYGRGFSTLKYDYLSTLNAIARVQGEDVPAHYLFTAVPFCDGFSEVPDQSKEFTFLQTSGDRLTVQPSNRVLFIDKSFTIQPEWPRDILRQTEWWSCEE